jgi:hypothetical protein
MQKIAFTKKNEKLPSGFKERVETLERDGAEKLSDTPRRFKKNLICVIKNGENGESSESVYFDDRIEFNQFRNTLLRCPQSQSSVTWLHY